MNTKKANLKKLRLPSTETKNGPRHGLIKASTISDFFSSDHDNSSKENDKEQIGGSEPMPSPIEYSQTLPSPIENTEDELNDKPRRSTRTILKTFIPMEKRMKPVAKADLSVFLTKKNDFETPCKSVKVAPKIKAKTKPNAKPKTNTRSKKQPKIKSAFFQNEELFSDVTAQHCLVDNVNPEEMQIALALSRSEIEISGPSVDENAPFKNTDIRDKLKKFGFQVAESEDFNYSAVYKPTKGKNKWANKFTPLTLRNSSRQLEKVNQKVEEILKIQYEFTSHDEEVCQVSVESSSLLPFVAANRIIQQDLSENLETVDFYVLSLFEPSKTKPGHLLKDMRRIPGRDRSPVYTKPSSREHSICDEEDCQLKSPVLKKVRVDESSPPIQSLLSPNIETECLELSLPSTINEPYDNIAESISSTECLKNSSSNTADVALKQYGTAPMHDTTSASTVSSIQFPPIRATSPDIFADSDVEMETDDSSEIQKMNSSKGDIMETYEIFSSDEIKVYSGSKEVPSFDKNHNSLVTLIDLTQQRSETSSQNSIKSIPTSEPIQTNQDTNDLPSTSFEMQLNDETLIKYGSINATDNTTVPGEAILTKRKHSLSIESDASDEFRKSTSFQNDSKDQEEVSIDLTQNDDELMDCIVLSDDEVNYSIRIAEKSLCLKDEKSSPDSSFESCSKENPEFSFVDLVAASQPLASPSQEFELSFSEKPNNSVSSPEMDLSKRSDFGILDEQSPFKTPTKTPKKTPRKTPTSSPKSSIHTANKSRRALSASFLDSPTESSAPLKRFSSSNKFKEFLKNDDESFSDLDDIDKLIYGSPTKKNYKKPAGLTQLLTGPINERIATPEKKNQEVPQEFEFNGRVYLVRTVDISRKPNFATMDESALLDRLYKYGIKPLKRKQAEKILEYIYNQTHPCLVDEADLPPTAAPVHDSNLPSQDERYNSFGEDNESEVNEEMPAEAATSKFNLKDCWGHVLLSETMPLMEIRDEQYFFQTNKSKKISTAPLPLHIAWYNLLKSNTKLHEAILYYEPIDLQEVYLFLKGIGYRYDPKEMKYFFDSRSIIFRYDVKKSESSAANRHVRKKRQKVKKI